ncbi:hypothetical protein ROHU_008098 [Labeo rohita]|uniref:CCHC-type domain-containing protein n=1 Tax=Labeo rohita TaxID=84645 RepID=A0A498MIJ9_LABRO|nr:hypothetical protein ROHU_008098 [Labeo rohita]
MEAARAKLEVYEREIKQENVPQIIQPNDRPSTLNDSSAPPTDLSLLAHAIQESIAANRLPIPTPSVFSGDPIHYIEWRASFQSLIDKKNISSADKFYYLKKYVSGSAQKCLEGTFYRNDEEAYRDGWNKLNRRYGQPFVIQRAFRDKLSKWPKIQAKDAEGLRAFSDFLNACSQAMPHVKGLEVLNDCEENQKLMLKVPDWLAASWNRKVTVALIDGEDFPTFKEFADFVSVEAEIACTPVTSLHALHSSYSFKERKDAREFKGTKANVFSIQTASNNNSSPSNGKAKPRCMWCKRDDHQLPKCLHFREQSLTDKRTYVKENNLCYGCLKPGHTAKECHHRQICDTCKGRHPTCLHDENYKASMGREGHLSLIKKLSNAPEESTAATALNVTRGDQSCITSMIVPVWVSVATDPDKEQLIYALLDTQSDSTFIDKETSYKLQVDTIPVKLKLTTMLGENIIVQSERVLGLRVRGYNSCVHIDLPPAYTKDCIPGNREHIPTHNTARSWPHLRAIAEKVPPLLSCEIGLLIGYNCPRALTPRQVLTGKDSEPYAICTDLGWSVVGSAVPSMDRGDVGLCHKVMVKELPPVTPMDVLGALESDFKDVKDHKVVSQEDLLFLDILKGSIKKNEQGHYEMPLPFRQRPRLPDNRKLAEKRLDHLRRKFSKEERAIHLEMLEDMSTDAFINGLRCFIAIRGAVRQIQCDQGTNFIGAKNEFKAALQELNEERLSSFLSQRQCDFVMNAPHSSHAGGVWERQIKTVRSVLSSILALAHNRLRDSVLRTVLYEVMAIVNSRPLTVDTLFSPDSLEPLTPNHLIQMKSISALPPPGTFPREDLYGARRWRQVQYLAEQFWSRWKPEYLHSIMARQKWHSPKRNLQVGDVVMDMDESSPRCEWKLAKVVDIVEGKDGLVRRVKISVGDKRLTKDGKRLSKLSILERPVQKLVLLLEA